MVTLRSLSVVAVNPKNSICVLIIICCLLSLLHRITAFIRRSDAFNVCMLLDTHLLDSYQGHGYHLPNDKNELPSGLGAFPAIFSFPGVSKVVSGVTIQYEYHARQHTGSRAGDQLVTQRHAHKSCSARRLTIAFSRY